VEPLPPVTRRSTRLALVAGGVVLLLGVVAFASRSGFGHSSKAAPSKAYISYAFTLFLILFVLMIPVTIYAWFLRAREDEHPKRASPARQLARSLALVAVFFVVVYVRHWLHLRFHTPTHHAAPPGHGHGHARSSPHAHAVQDSSPHFEWLVLWIALGLGAIGVTSLVVLHRRYLAGRPPVQGPEVGEDVAATISEAIDDLEREPDPRRAVIAAYARMEGVLGRHGFRRRPSETPLEYMRRVLLELTTSGRAVERLTSDFEQAKFSAHEIDAAMKADAIGALREIRDGMATA
jgi:hypothetical protein